MPLAAGISSESAPTEQRLNQVVAGVAERFDLGEVRLVEAAPPVLTPLEGARLDEIKQHLIDLEYLDPSPAEIEATRPTRALLAGLSSFLVEAGASLEAPLAEAAQPAAPGDPWFDEAAAGAGAGPPSAVAQELLRRATSFDGESTLERRPAIGEGGLAVRVLHFQLKRLGLFHQRLANPVGPATLHALNTAAAGFRRAGLPHDGPPPVSSEEMLPLLGDIRLLLARMARHVGRTPIVYRAPGQRGDDEDFDDIRVREGRFETRGGFFSGVTGLFSSRPSWDDDWPEYETAEERLQSLQNTLVLRFLQIGLWSLGFYAQRLDGIWNPACHEALLAALETYDIDREDVLRVVEGGFLAVNLPRLVEEVFGPGGIGEEEFQQQLAMLDANTEEAADGAAAAERESGLWTQVASGIRAALRTGARVLSGVKSLLKSAVDGLKKGVQWVGGAVARLIGPIKNFVLFAYRGAREGLQMLVRAITPFVHFVLRKPIVTLDGEDRAAVLTKFDLDRDALVWVAPGAAREVVDEHAGLCRRLARALSVVLAFMGEALDLLIAAATGPLGWTRILVAALRKLIDPGWLKLLPV